MKLKCCLMSLLVVVCGVAVSVGETTSADLCSHPGGNAFNCALACANNIECLNCCYTLPFEWQYNLCKDACHGHIFE